MAECNKAATLITSPSDMAELLFNASPHRAAACALAAHEQACERGDFERMEFWNGVFSELTALQSQSERRAVEAA